MKFTLVVLSAVFVSMNFSSHAYAKAQDVFFKGTSKLFFLTKHETVNNIPAVRYSPCQVNDDEETARCSDLAVITEVGFAKIQACLDIKLKIAKSQAVLGAIFGSGFALGSVGLIGVPGAQGLSLYLAGSSAKSFLTSVHGFDAIGDVEEKMEVFSGKVFTDADHAVELKFDDFLSYLSESLKENLITCDASGFAQKLNSGLYQIKLSESQIRSIYLAQFGSDN